MQIAKKIILVLTILLGVATGLFKITQQPEDIELFKVLGFNALVTTLLGILQLMGALLLILARTREIGAWTLVLTFAIASMAVFANEMYVFGFISLLFIAMAYFVLYSEKNLK